MKTAIEVSVDNQNVLEEILELMAKKDACVGRIANFCFFKSKEDAENAITNAEIYDTDGVNTVSCDILLNEHNIQFNFKKMYVYDIAKDSYLKAMYK